MLHKFRYAKPASRQELLDLLAESPGQAKLLAGGTDLLVNIRGGLLKANSDVRAMHLIEILSPGGAA